MAGGSDDGAPRDVLRRGLFRQFGAAGAAAIAGTPLAPGVAVAQDLGDHAAQDHAVSARQSAQLEALETLTAAEADTLEAIVARLIRATRTAPAPPRRARRITSIAPSPVRCAPRAKPMRPGSPPSTPMRNRGKAPLSRAFRQRISMAS
jgi:hypothetical protein